MEKINDLHQASSLQRGDIIVQKTNDQQKEYLIQLVNDKNVMAIRIGTQTELKILPPERLVSDNWYIK